MTDRDERSFQPVRVRRPREQVESQIRAAILGGEFQAGDRLPSEAVLAKDFGVSRSTVREALSALSEAGLISTSAGATGGSFVAEIDHRALSARFGASVENIVRLGSLTYAEVAAVRMMLEVPSARLAARFRTDEDLTELDEMIDEQRSVDGSAAAVRGLNARFHEAIANASGNRLLAAMISALHRALEESYNEIPPQVSRRSAKHHLKIVAAIRERDEDAAAAAIEDDVREFHKHDGAVVDSREGAGRSSAGRARKT